MIKITVKPDCGNAPKNELLKNLNIAFAEGNLPWLRQRVTDDIVWDRVGDTKVEGKENFFAAIEKMKATKVSELKIDRVLTHGKEGAVSGSMVTGKGKRFAFSDFYEFSSARAEKIKTITSYIIPI